MNFMVRFHSVILLFSAPHSGLSFLLARLPICIIFRDLMRNENSMLCSAWVGVNSLPLRLDGTVDIKGYEELAIHVCRGPFVRRVDLESAYLKQLFFLHCVSK